MITKEITLCSKTVTLGYCYATEIAYKDLTNADISDYMQEAITAISNSRMPDIKRTIYAILACLIAVYEDAERAPITDMEIMKEASPEEIGTTLGTIIALRARFYHLPDGEPKDKKKKGRKSKN